MITTKFIKDNIVAIIVCIAGYGALMYQVTDIKERVVRLEDRLMPEVRFVGGSIDDKTIEIK